MLKICTNLALKPKINTIHGMRRRYWSFLRTLNGEMGFEREFDKIAAIFRECYTLREREQELLLALFRY